MKKKDNSRRLESSCQHLSLLAMLICTAFRSTGSSKIDVCSCNEADDYNMIHIGNIPESIPEGTIVKKLNFIGGDKILLSAVYSKSLNIVFDNITQEFKINKKFNITNSTPLLLDDIKVVCTIIATNQRIVYTVFAEVYDENNNVPIFVNVPYIFNISESTPQGSAILPEIIALDADPSDAGKLTYSIKSTNEYSSYFNFTIPSSGRLTLIKELNFEFVKHFNFLVEVKDNSYDELILGRHQVQHTTSTDVTINVESVFGDMLQTVKTLYILNYSGSERDIPIDSSFQYGGEYELSLVTNSDFDDWKYFQVTNTSHLQVVGNLTKTQYVLLIKVKQRPRSIFMTPLVVINVNKSQKFLNPTKNLILAENTLIGTLVVKMETSNHQESTKFYFFEETAETKFFHLEQSSGLITTSRNLHEINKNVFNITIGLSDYSNHRDKAILNITISRIIDSSPKFSKASYDFQYSNSVQIGRVQASDPMSSNKISYRLIDIYKKFSIDHEGMISCKEFDSIHDLIIGLVVIAEAETPFNRSDSALVLIRQSSKSDNWFAAFIVSIVLACILLILAIVFAARLCAVLRRGTPVMGFHKRISKQNIGKINSKKCTEIQSVSSDVPQVETSSIKMLVRQESVASVASMGPGLQLASDLNVHKRQDRIDWASSQETINASNMTLTRPAVGTNGITLYY